LAELLNIISSAIGSLTNPNKLSLTFKSVKNKTISPNTIRTYIEYFEDSFLIDSAFRYDVKGKKYINTPLKYYFTDLGLRNARLNFRQVEETHAMENIIFNELKVRGYNVDVGVVTSNEINKSGKSIRKQLEIDFVCNKASKRYYVQSALRLSDESKREREQRSLLMVPDAFKKVIITKDAPAPLYNEDGILVMSIFDFLLDEDSLER
jgi:predicted AAA+ superfamily ATPase